MIRDSATLTISLFMLPPFLKIGEVEPIFRYPVNTSNYRIKIDRIVDSPVRVVYKGGHEKPERHEPPPPSPDGRHCRPAPLGGLRRRRTGPRLPRRVRFVAQ